jgi:hypothetical protein
MANTFFNKFSSGIGTSLTAVGGYVVPADSSTTVVVVGLSVANTTATSINVEVTLNDGSTDYYVIKDAPVNSGASLVVVGGDQKIVLEAGHSIKVNSSASASADAIMSIMEIT